MSGSLLNEYISKRMSASDLEEELTRLIKKYNSEKKSYLVIYAVDIEKNYLQGSDLSLNMGDYQILHEMLRNIASDRLDMYIETPGGSGEAAEEIVEFLHNKFETIDFVIAGEAKSAGTLMAMSADEIYMTDSGSLGPIDAQVRIGRSVISAFDYVEWMKGKREEAQKTNSLNPVDATMIAQITPGEYEGVYHAQQFVVDKLKEWLPKYKFKHWKQTESRKIPVTEKMKTERAKTIAEKMIDHSIWRSHGRSLKLKDLESIGLRIKNCKENHQLCDIVYRIRQFLSYYLEVAHTINCLLPQMKNYFVMRIVQIQSGKTKRIFRHQ
jgi:ClpP class serine protease